MSSEADRLAKERLSGSAGPLRSYEPNERRAHEAGSDKEAASVTFIKIAFQDFRRHVDTTAMHVVAFQHMPVGTLAIRAIVPRTALVVCLSRQSSGRGYR